MHSFAILMCDRKYRWTQNKYKLRTAITTRRKSRYCPNLYNKRKKLFQSDNDDLYLLERKNNGKKPRKAKDEWLISVCGVANDNSRCCQVTYSHIHTLVVAAIRFVVLINIIFTVFYQQKWMITKNVSWKRKKGASLCKFIFFSSLHLFSFPVYAPHHSFNIPRDIKEGKFNLFRSLTCKCSWNFIGNDCAMVEAVCFAFQPRMYDPINLIRKMRSPFSLVPVCVCRFSL